MKAIVIDEELHRKLKVLAADKGVSLKNLVSEILKSYIKANFKSEL